MAKAAVAIKPWYQNFQIVAYVVAGMTALGTVVVVSNRYIVLPQRADAAEKAIDDLKGWAKEIQGYTKAMQQQQQAPNQMAHPVSQGLREYDGETCWECPLTDRDQCYVQQQWRYCE